MEGVRGSIPLSSTPRPRAVSTHLESAVVTDDMHGRTVLVTGGNTGVGKATAVALAAAGADVVFTSRDADKGAVALADVRERSGSSSVDVMELDLARFASVRDFAGGSRASTNSSTSS